MIKLPIRRVIFHLSESNLCLFLINEQIPEKNINNIAIKKADGNRKTPI